MTLKDIVCYKRLLHLYARFTSQGKKSLMQERNFDQKIANRCDKNT